MRVQGAEQFAVRQGRISSKRLPAQPPSEATHQGRHDAVDWRQDAWGAEDGRGHAMAPGIICPSLQKQRFFSRNGGREEW